MKIIVIKDNVTNSKSLCLSGRGLLVRALLILVVLPVALALASYWVVAKIDRSLNPFIDQEYRIAVESRVNEQELQISKTRDYVRQHMDVLGSRIGSLQAQVSRINAVEQRIAESTGVDLVDFTFSEDPPVGGTGSELDSEQIDIENAISEIEYELTLRESEIATIDFLLSRKNLESQQTPAGWPVDGGWVSSSFGSRMHPITGKKQFHGGVDIPGKEGSNVLAVADGVITKSEKNSSQGWVVVIDHGDGYQTLYAHNKANLVVQGETIIKGQAVAQIGSTGISTGPHVHFEVSKDGSRINPVKYLYKKT